MIITIDILIAVVIIIIILEWKNCSDARLAYCMKSPKKGSIELYCVFADKTLTRTETLSDFDRKLFEKVCFGKPYKAHSSYACVEQRNLAFIPPLKSTKCALFSIPANFFDIFPDKLVL